MTFKQDAQYALYAPDKYRSSYHDPVIVTMRFVEVDILPRSCDNSFNIKAKGGLPVAILGKAELDVTQISPATLTLAGVAPLRWSTEDVATLDDCSSKKGDGYVDLVLHFDAQEIVGVLGEVYDGDIVTLKLIGHLSPEFGGTPVIGEDMLWIIKKGK